MSNRIKRALQFAALGIAFVAHLAHAGMTTPGQFAVSPSGGATYSIPIQVPPGTGGIEPKLALTYNSQAGNGLLGMGWSLSGLSAITRCPRTMAQDNVRGSVNYDNNDRYCLDGQRLIALSGQADGANGTEYRTELDGFAKIVSYGTAGNGPAWFKVWTKSGQVMEYGNTGDSKIEPIKVSGTPVPWVNGTVRQWSINKVSDTKGNYLTVSYTKDDVGAFYPQKIAYTGNANNNISSNSSVQFEYDQARPDTTSSFYLGSVTTVTKRLSHIKTFSGSSTAPIKDYRLAYTVGQKTGRSELTSISECDAQSKCLLPTSLSWIDGPRAGFNLPKVASWASGGTPSDRWFMMLDVNNDGKSDTLLYEPASGNLIVGLANGNNGFSPTVTTYFGTGGSPSNRWFTMADVNGDGLPDAVRYEPANGFVYVALGVGNGGFAPAVSTYFSSGGSPADRWFTMVDVNGDGKADAVRYEPSNGFIYVALSVDNGGFSPAVSTYFGSGGSPSDRWFTMVDVNGDGLPDAVRYEPANGLLYVALGVGNGGFAPAVSTSFASGGSPADRRFTVADVNGDGLPDAVLYELSSGNLTVAPSLGNGYFGTRVSSYFGSGGTISDRWFTMADVNGDGRNDAIRYEAASGAIVVAFARADGTFDTPINTAGHGSGGSTNDRWFMIADVNGDGMADAVRYEPNGGNIVISSASAPIPDVISSIDTGFLSTTVVTQPLTSTGVYTKDSGANASVLPKIDLQMPMYVVSSVTSTNGIGGVLTTTYSYGGLKAEAGSGRGLLGFRWMQSTQQDSGITSYTEFRQDYPYTGLPSFSKKTIAGGGNNGVLNQVSTQYDCLDPATGGTCAIGPGHRYFPYAKLGTESSWDLDGSALPTIVTAGQYDIWGNATQISVTTSDGYGKTTVNTYAPADTDKWYLGRLTKATVTSIAP